VCTIVEDRVRWLRVGLLELSPLISSALNDPPVPLPLPLPLALALALPLPLALALALALVLAPGVPGPLFGGPLAPAALAAFPSKKSSSCQQLLDKSTHR
jgi:hypothetical protein